MACDSCGALGSVDEFGMCEVCGGRYRTIVEAIEAGQTGGDIINDVDIFAIDRSGHHHAARVQVEQRQANSFVFKATLDRDQANGAELVQMKIFVSGQLRSTKDLEPLVKTPGTEITIEWTFKFEGDPEGRFMDKWRT